jgi:trk system potassium uptake protein
MKKQFVVIGLGRFGSSVATTLTQAGNDVLCVDSNEDLVEDIAPYVTHAVRADATDEKALKAIGIRNFDTAVIAIGQDIQSSILITLLCKEQGVPYVLVKAKSENHAKVLEKIGADKIVFPERDMGIKVAHNLASENILDFIEVSPDYSMMEVGTIKKWEGRNLIDLNFRQIYNLNVIAIKNDAEKITINPPPNDVIENGDRFVVVGLNTDIKKLVDYIAKNK